MTLAGSIALFGLTAVAAWLAGFPLRRLLARAGVMDLPGEHSSHSEPVPRGGGLLLVAAFFGWIFLDHRAAELPGVRWLAWGVAAVAAVSFADDIRSLSRRVRFTVYTLAAAGFVAAVLEHPGLAAWGQPWLLAFLLWLWVAGYANAFNFIDGLDGLAASQGLIAALAGAAVCALAGESPAAGALVAAQLALAGAMAGFLGHNFSPARLFLGDVGSIAAGFALAALAVIAGAELGWRAGAALAALHLGTVLDTGITLARRAAAGHAVWLRHREFFFHRALRSGRSHRFVTGAEAAVQSAAAATILAAFAFAGPAWLFLAALGGTASLWLGFFAWCERAFRRRDRVG